MVLLCWSVPFLIWQKIKRTIETIKQVIKRIYRTVLEEVEQWVEQKVARQTVVKKYVCDWLPWPLDLVCGWVDTLVTEIVTILVKVVTHVVRTVCDVIVETVTALIEVVLFIPVLIFAIVCVVVRLLIWLGGIIEYILSNLWTLPNTLLGFFIGIFLTFCLPAYRHGFWVFCCGRGISKLVRGKRGPIATTFGYAVIFWDPAYCNNPAKLAHEAYHVRQYNILGPFFIPLYLLLLLIYRDWGRAHPLENPAYQREDTYVPGSPINPPKRWRCYLIEFLLALLCILFLASSVITEFFPAKQYTMPVLPGQPRIFEAF